MNIKNATKRISRQMGDVERPNIKNGIGWDAAFVRSGCNEMEGCESKILNENRTSPRKRARRTRISKFI
jgi:hypothetical protein